MIPRKMFLASHGHSSLEVDGLVASQTADDAKLSTKGLGLTLYTHFGDLKRVNAEFRDRGFDPLIPIFDPDHEDVSEDDGFWLCAHRPNGEVVAVMAARLRQVRDFMAALNDNTFLMGPTPPDGASSSLDIAGIDGIAGPVAYIGALWVLPSEQGAYLSALMVRSVVRTAFYRWTPKRITALVSDRDVHLARRVYGFRQVHGAVRFKDPRWDFAPPRCALLTISDDEVRAKFLQADPIQPTRTA